MGLNANDERVDNTTRLMNIAFWYWEYMRRNAHYIKYCNTIEKYKEYFDNIGEWEYLNSEEGFEELNSYYYDNENEYDVKNNPYITRIEAAHGVKAGSKFFKFSFLAEKYRDRFKRIYKHYSTGIDTEEWVSDLIKEKHLLFITRDNADIAALLRMHDSWSIQIDNDTPTYYIHHLEKSGPITINAQGILDNPSKIGLEAHAINIIHKSINGLIKEQFVEKETYNAVYKICIAGKKINPADEARLVSLWLWDEAHKVRAEKPASFDDAYQKLQEKAKGANASGGIWEQVLYRKHRMRSYYEKVAQSIAQLAVLPLNSK